MTYIIYPYLDAYNIAEETNLEIEEMFGCDDEIREFIVNNDFMIFSDRDSVLTIKENEVNITDDLLIEFINVMKKIQEHNPKLDIKLERKIK